MKEVHDKKNGSFANCHRCGFRALSQAHLDLHERRHHVELKCEKCDFKTQSQNRLKTHIKVKHGENSATPRTGDKPATARTTPRKYSVKCKFNLRCRNVRSCRYEHDTPQRNNIQYVNPWQPLASQSQAVDDVVPFLEVMTQVLRNLRRGGN